MPKVSVLMPAYNQAAYVAQAIESVFAQTYEDWELIIVDDGSTDNTADVVRRFASSLTYIYQSNRGCPAALNRAFKMSKGQYISILGSDDLLLPRALEILSHFLDANPSIDIVYSDGYVCDEQGNNIGRLSNHRYMPYGETLDSFVVTSPVPGVNSAMMRRSRLEKLDGPFDEAMLGYEDWDLFIRLAALGCRFGYVNELTCKYRIHPGQKTSPASPMAEKRRASLIRNRFKVLNASFFPRLSKEARRHFLYMMLVEQLRGEIELQEQVLHSEGFASLLDGDQGALLYYLAVENIIHDREVGLGRERLRQAAKFTPDDLKPRLALALSAWGRLTLAAVIKPRRAIGRLLQMKSDVPPPLPAGRSFQSVKAAKRSSRK